MVIDQKLPIEVHSAILEFLELRYLIKAKAKRQEYSKFDLQACKMRPK